MTLFQMLDYLGGAVGYAVISAVPITAAISFRRGKFWRKFFLVLTTLFLVFLAIHPFPSRSGLVCPIPGALPQLVPGRFLQPIAELWRAGASFRVWITNTYVASTVMNLAVCSMIGFSLTWLGKERLSSAIVFGFGLSLAIELTQLTGLWGIYPCAYRQFDVDDLILNVLGVILGFLIGRWVLAHRCRRGF